MEVIKAETVEEARRLIDKAANKKEKIVVQGRDAEFNRKMLENKKVNMLILSHTDKHDKLKERDSGLNQVLCKIARDKGKLLAIDFSELKNSEDKEQGKILGRIRQNLKLIKKYKCNLVILNKPDKRNLQSLLQVLGLDTKIASQLSN